MISSGIRRGLAVSAISALALAGMSMAPAQARTIGGGGETILDLYSFQHVNSYSTANDGSADSQNTVTLLAGLPNGGGVNTVKFSYTNGTGSHDIATVVPIDGLATFEWTPPTGVDGDSVSQVRADALDAANVSLANAVEAMNGDPNPNANPAISVDGAPRSDLGLNPDGEVVLRGLTALAPPANIGDAYPNVTGWIAGPRTQTSAAAVRSGNTLGSGLTPFAAVVTVDPTNLTTDPVDEIIGEATNSPGVSVDDVNAYSVYDAIVTTINKPTTAGHGPNLAGNADGVGTNTDDWTHYNVTVIDQKGQPVSGVNIYESDESGNNLAGFNGMGRLADDSGTFDADETNFNGVLPIRLNESGAYGVDGIVDQDPAVGVGATYIVVDNNADGAFQGGTDTIVKLTASTLPQAPATVTITSSKGNVMDDDEQTNLTFTVKDANGDPIPNFALAPTISRDVADNTPADSTTPIPGGPFVTNASGQVVVNNVQAGVDNNEVAVTVKATAGAITGTLAIETDEAEIVWDEGQVDQALNGTSVTEAATLQLPSGSVLPARNVALTYTPAGNSRFAPNAEQPAGTISGTPTTANATTNATTGKFAVKVTDPPVPNGEEVGSVITADAPTLESFASETDSDLTLDFLRSLTPNRVEIHNPITSDQTDGLQVGLPGVDLMPGALGVATVQAFNSDNRELDDVDVNMTIDEGVFVDITDPFEGTPAVGGLVDFKSAGESQTVSTDDGEGLVIVNIKRNTGFDDDGEVDDKLHATAGSATDDHDFTWTTNAAPLNQGSFTVSLAGDQDSSILPKARAGNGDSAQSVFYDVKTTDQFGNRTSQDLNVTDNTPVAGFGCNSFPCQSAFDLTNPAIEAFSPGAANQALEVELQDAQKLVYSDDPGDSSFDPASPTAFIDSVPVDIQTTTDPINWYTVNLNDRSLYTLTQEGSENVPVGSTVSYTLTAIDPQGQPINGSGVGFLRVGPGDQGQDDDGQADDVTNAAGEAFYDFAGSVPGTASVSAVVYDDRVGGNYHRLFVVGPDTVSFTGSVVPIKPKLTGENSGKMDVLTVSAKKAAGASVKFYKKTAHGLVLLKTSQLNVNGIKSFSVRDKNGNKVTKYVAIVSNTPRTQRGVSNTVRLR
ncbi:MAG: hypothetical protein JWO11_2758 [Nocardioides sp.]|nr:hypothetical protein [Nocardioides sp.]